MADQDCAARIFHNTLFYFDLCGCLPSIAYGTIMRSRVNGPVGCHEAKSDAIGVLELEVDDVLGAIGLFSTALIFTVCGFPYWQRVTALSLTAYVTYLESINKGCDGKPKLTHLLPFMLALGFGLIVGLSIECMQRGSYLRTLHADKKVETLLMQYPTALIVLDLQGRITHLNAHSISMLGVGLDKLAGLHFSSVLVPRPPFRQRALSAIEQACAGGSIRSLLLSLRRLVPSEACLAPTAAAADGGNEEMEVLMSMLPNLDDDGNYCGVVCFLQDCTEIKRLQRDATEHAMEQARMRAIEENLAVTFHELRNPLNGCVGFQRLATQKLDEVVKQICGEKGSAAFAHGTDEGGGLSINRQLSENLQHVSRDLDQALLCADHAVRFLQSLASIHRLFSHGLGEASLSLVNLNDALANAASIVKPQLKPGVSFDLQLPPHVVWAYIDSTRMSQVIINLGQNAARFTTKGFVSIICTYSRNGHSCAMGGDSEVGNMIKHGEVAEHSGAGVLTVMVRDTGCGLPNKVKQTLAAAVQPQSAVDVGCGLGLYLAQKLLGSLGATLEIRSPWREEGSGAEFKFSVEIREGTALPKDTAEVQPSVQLALSLPGPLRVLIADDLSVNRLLLSRMLKKCMSSAVECTTVSTVEAAIEAAGKQHFDFIFMDENFSAEEGALTGTFAVREIRKAELENASERALIVSCTGCVGEASDDAVNKKFFSAGSDAVWGKPVPSHVDGSMQREIARLLRSAKR